MGFKAINVANNNTISVFAVGGIGRVESNLQHVVQGIARSQNGAARGRKDVHPCGLIRQFGQGKIGAFVPVIGQWSAPEIRSRCCWIVIHEMLCITGFAKRAVDRKLQQKIPRRGRRGEG